MPNDKQQAQFDTVCERIADGMSLRAICDGNDVPTAECIRLWLKADEDGDLVAQYARAREEQADHYADEIIDIADNEPDPQKARNRVDARKWVASKLKPKRYGERLQHSGDADNPIRHQVIEWRSVKAD